MEITGYGHNAISWDCPYEESVLEIVEPAVKEVAKSIDRTNPQTITQEDLIQWQETFKRLFISLPMKMCEQEKGAFLQKTCMLGNYLLVGSKKEVSKDLSSFQKVVKNVAQHVEAFTPKTCMRLMMALHAFSHGEIHDFHEQQFLHSLAR